MELLSRPRDEACRLVALKYLDEALEAKANFGIEPEALHDLRVALRRFRSTARAWDLRPRPRLRRELRRVIDATSGARDAEVMLELLAEEGLKEGQLVEELEWRKAEGYAHVLEGLVRYPQLDGRLRRGLSRVEIDLLHPHKMAYALADAVDDHADDVEDDLFELKVATQVEEAHSARISVKRLRYLVEPYDDDPAVDKLVKGCKALQDTLGDLHDTHLAMREAVPAEVMVRLIERQDRLFAAVGTPSLAAQAHGLAAALRLL
jgi:CHAD domain-containing protein